MNRMFSKPALDFAQNRRAIGLGIVYAVVIGVSFYLAYEIRFDFLVDTPFEASRLQMLPAVIGIKLVALIAARQFGTMMTYFSIPDLLRLLWAMVVASAILLLVRLVAGTDYSAPRGVLLVDFMLCTGTLCAGRLGLRLLRERLAGGRRDGRIVQAQRIAIIGAGDAGAALARDLINSPLRGFRPVMFFDDDREKHGKLVHGVPVIGRPEAIADVRDIEGLSRAIIAMPSAPAKRIREVVAAFTAQGIKIETVPSLAELASGRVKATRIRPVEVADLLGRQQVELDSEGIRNSLQGRVVLVTGAGGSIGSELCRQIAACAPKQLLMVEQCEGALFVIEQELNELGLGSLAVPLVGDILDEERMRYIFSHYGAEVVFHAAAHKHVFMMERQPAEAIRNNVLGTRLLAEIAADCGVEKFVLISTDKAINPTSVMGATKRLAELQLQAIAATDGVTEGRKAGITEGQKVGIPEGQLAGERAEFQKDGISEGLLNAQGPAEKVITEGGNGDAGNAAKGLVKILARHGAAPAQVRAPIQNSGSTEGQKDGGTEFRKAGRTEFRKHGSPEFQKDGISEAGKLTAEIEGQPEVRKDGGSEFPKAGRTEFRKDGGVRRRTKFVAVRFGNVLGSSGSVIPIFKRQIANGGPVTVTHPEVTRYFMTIPEAVGLVLQTSILGQGGEIFVLDMGRPVKIVDLARQMIELSGFKVDDDIEIKFTGLKPGEKLYEELQHKTEQYTETSHPRIMRFTTNAMFSESGVQELRQRLYDMDSNQLKNMLKRLVPEYTPFLD